MELVKRKFRLYVQVLLAGLLAGAAAAVFLHSLKWATDFREKHHHIVFFLPLAGLLIGWLYHRFGKDVVAGNNLVIDEIHDPKKIIPARMAPLVLVGTLLTHLFGGSAGREGTAVQMAGSLADQVGRLFKSGIETRRLLLICGMGAGFGAALGTPWAGAVFGMEVLRLRRLHFAVVVESILASFVAFYTAQILLAPHTHYPAVTLPGFAWTHLLWIGLAGVGFGFTAGFFIWITHRVENLAKKIKYPPLRPFVGGLILILLYFSFDLLRYAGLGIPVIEEALIQSGYSWDPLLKTGLTALTLGTGFKGGEFIPLVFIGTTLGNLMASFIPLSFSFLGALGFAAVFAGAANTPMACAVMAAELFGWSIWPYALLTCVISSLCSGKMGIYSAQRR